MSESGRRCDSERGVGRKLNVWNTAHNRVSQSKTPTWKLLSASHSSSLCLCSEVRESAGEETKEKEELVAVKVTGGHPIMATPII